MNTQQPFAIVANYKLLGGDYADAAGTGLWEGLREPVGMFLIDSETYTERTIVDAAKEIGEAAIVVVDANRQAHLVWTDGNLTDEHLGRWTEITPEQAQHLDAWTEIDGRYFTTVK